jgi:hypothetical protein
MAHMIGYSCPAAKARSHRAVGDAQQDREPFVDGDPHRMNSLPTIQMFWHGSPLSRVERLCIASFRENGHPVDLYVYDDVGVVPDGVRLMDAGEILPHTLLFRHRRSQSVGLFADWFRYRLLHERGGIWADADVVCLKPFEYTGEEIYAWSDERYINNAVLGLPAGHELARWLDACCENPNRPLPYDDLRIRLRKWRRRTLEGDRRDRVRWGENGPKALTLAARHLGYHRKALPSWHFYPVPAERRNLLFQSGGFEFNGSRAVHLWNHLLVEQPRFNKNARFPEDSPFEQLCRRYLRSGG